MQSWGCGWGEEMVYFESPHLPFLFGIDALMNADNISCRGEETTCLPTTPTWALDGRCRQTWWPQNREGSEVQSLGKILLLQ